MNSLTEPFGIDGDTLGAVVRLVDANQAISQLEHVVTETDYDELGVLGALLKRKRRALQ